MQPMFHRQRERGRPLREGGGVGGGGGGEVTGGLGLTHWELQLFVHEARL